MKSKRKAKTRNRSKSKPSTKTKTHRQSKPKAEHASIEASLIPNVRANATLKSCQEVEVGDIGGFGSSVELEEHEKHCNEPAMEYCTNCGKNLCRNHYDLMHRDHDHSSQNPTISQA